ncbi:hypothetical protein [Streptomyces sp. 6N223]|uniref:hypothetical protein n=1 Tax=Streptomyces sp. 6N223 TaxID=3457412 RepID=UPI003FD5C47C
MVLGPDNLPVITEPALAAKDVGLATLSAVVHSTHENAGAIPNALVAALKTLDHEHAKSLALLIYAGLGKNPAAEHWRQLMTINPDVFRGLDPAGFLPDELLDRVREKFRDQVREEVVRRSVTRNARKATRTGSCGFWRSGGSPFPRTSASG